MAKAAMSPRKAGRHRRPSTASNGPKDGSGRQPRVSSQGEVWVTVPNETDPLRDGPIDRRLTWKEPSPLVLTQPTAQPRDRAAWEDLCVATDFETGKLQGEVGTPENPGLTYEEAVHNRRSGRTMTLYVREDIVQAQAGRRRVQVAPAATGDAAQRMGRPGTSLGLDGLPCGTSATDP